MARNMFEDFTNSTALSEHLIFDGIQQMPIMPREDYRISKISKEMNSIYAEPKYYLGKFNRLSLYRNIINFMKYYLKVH